MRIMRRFRGVPGAATLIIGIALFGYGTQQAGAAVTSVNIFGDQSRATEGWANFSGSLSVDDETNQLTVSLTNTTSLAQGATNADAGYLTGFVLNNPSSLTAVNLASALPAGFTQLGLTNDGIAASPFGRFDFGATLGGNFQGGGNPAGGIARGDTGSFVFNLTGSPLPSASDFLSAFSVGPGIGEGPAFFVARFRGANEDFYAEGSDRVPAVPVPAALPLMLTALGVLAVVARKKVKAVAT
jgi:hypothetical protein